MLPAKCVFTFNIDPAQQGKGAQMVQHSCKTVKLASKCACLRGDKRAGSNGKIIDRQSDSRLFDWEKYGFQKLKTKLRKMEIYIQS